MSRKGIVTVTLLFLVAFLLLQVATRGYREVESLQSMEKAMAAVRRDFPDVNPVSSAQLATLLGETGSVVLIDARAPEEYAMSRIPGAMEGTSPGVVKAMSDDAKRVVVYDSVGFRSAEWIESIGAAGSEKVFYLEGGIFRWAIEALPLVDGDGNPTTKVHPYNKLWGRLLERN